MIPCGFLHSELQAKCTVFKRFHVNGVCDEAVSENIFHAIVWGCIKLEITCNQLNGDDKKKLKYI